MLLESDSLHKNQKQSSNLKNQSMSGTNLQKYNNALSNPHVTRIRPWSSNRREKRQTRNNERPHTSASQKIQDGRHRKKMAYDSIGGESVVIPVHAWAVTQLPEHEEYCETEDYYDDRKSPASTASNPDVEQPSIDDITFTEKNDITESTQVDDVKEEVEEKQEDEYNEIEDTKEDKGDFESWVRGSDVPSDEYDTDLEDDFPPEPEPPADPTGAYKYEEYCKKAGLVPVSYLKGIMGGGNMRMRHHYLGGTGTKPLADALKSNTVLEEIDLSDNYMEGSGAAALATMLKDNMFIVNLNISNNFIRTEGAAAFAEMLETNTTLKTLSVKGNQLSDTDAKRVAEAMKSNMSLMSLDLSNNCFGETGGIYLAAGIAANIGLSDLDLSWNGIRGKGAVEVGKALAKNQSLEIFDLSWNGLGDDGTMALAQSIRSNKSLKVLDLSNNRIGTEAAKKLGQSLGKNQGIVTLLLGMNPIAEEGVEAILKGVNSNTSLKLLGLEGIAVSPKLHEMVKDITKDRDIMIMFSTGSPQQSRINQTILAVFDRFVTDNADRMEDLFNQMDKDRTGNITLEEFKYGLKDLGLRLTGRQLDLLLDELDADRSGTIELEELMAGSELVEQEKQKMARVEKENKMFSEGVQHVQNTDNTSSEGSEASKLNSG